MSGSFPFDFKFDKDIKYTNPGFKKPNDKNRKNEEVISNWNIEGMK